MKINRKDNLVYIDDILSAIKKINKFCKGIEKYDFLKNELLMDAVVRNLEIIGEAATKLTVSFRERYKEIEWRKLIGMRNRIIHAYDTVNFEIVWTVDGLRAENTTHPPAPPRRGPYFIPLSGGVQGWVVSFP